MVSDGITFMLVCVVTGLVFVLLDVSTGAAIPPDEKRPFNDFESQIGYLSRYGYLDKVKSAGLKLKSADPTFIEAIKDFQFMYGLAETGVIDDETLDSMSQPRCGFHDNVTEIRHSHSSRKKRYATVMNTRYRRIWQEDEMPITYGITKPTTDLSMDEQNGAVAEAVKGWSDKAGLSFKHDADQPDIEIWFAENRHCNWNDSFDGPGGTLAHATFPYFGGDMHIDDGETWIIEEKWPRIRNSFYLNWVVAHELGHNLGLLHTNVRGSLMFPSYGATGPVVKLGQDDIRGIQSLYGANIKDVDTVTAQNNPPPEQTTEPTKDTDSTDDVPDPTTYCVQPKIDAIMTTSQGKTYAFQGAYYYILTNNGVLNYKGNTIESLWTGVTGPVDAATEIGNKLYIFKGEYVYTFYQNTSPVSGARLIRDVFPCSWYHTCKNDDLRDFDDVFIWKNGKVYFMKGTTYYRRTSQSEGDMDPYYPRNTAIWGLPNVPLDAMFKWRNGKSYFFSGKDYYRLDDRTLGVDTHTSVPYPRPINYWWFGCSLGSQLVASENDIVHHEAFDIMDDGAPILENEYDRPDAYDDRAMDSLGGATGNGVSDRLCPTTLTLLITVFLVIHWVGIIFP